jgi:hypothetical protein
VFFIGGYLSYRALFNWMHWSYYIPTMLGAPVFQVLFFAYMGRFAEVENDEFFVVGNAVQASALAGIFGMAMTIGGERWTQTLSPLLATPANRFALFMGRALPNFVNGLIVSTFGFLVGWAFLDFDPPLSSLPGLAACVLVSAASCTAFGMVIGSIGLDALSVFLRPMEEIRRALHPSMPSISLPSRRIRARVTPGRLALLVGAVVLAQAVIVVEWLRGQPDVLARVLAGQPRQPGRLLAQRPVVLVEPPQERRQPSEAVAPQRRRGRPPREAGGGCRSGSRRPSSCRCSSARQPSPVPAPRPCRRLPISRAGDS